MSFKLFQGSGGYMHSHFQSVKMILVC